MVHSYWLTPCLAQMRFGHIFALLFVWVSSSSSSPPPLLLCLLSSQTVLLSAFMFQLLRTVGLRAFSMASETYTSGAHSAAFVTCPNDTVAKDLARWYNQQHLRPCSEPGIGWSNHKWTALSTDSLAQMEIRQRVSCVLHPWESILPVVVYDAVVRTSAYEEDVTWVGGASMWPRTHTCTHC